MYNKRLTCFLAACCLLTGSLPVLAQSTRKKINFDNDWKFHLGHAADTLKDFNYTTANSLHKSGNTWQTPMDARFNDSNWRSLQLPHDWVVELPFENSLNAHVMSHGYKPVGGLYPQNSIGWYRKKFTLNRTDSGQRFVLQFDGVFRDSRVWVNGIYLGNNFSGYIGMSYDITDYVYFNRPNIVVVRADASQYEGWFYEGAGIYRHAWLQQYNNLHIPEDGIFVHTKEQGSNAAVAAAIKVSNRNYSATDGTVYNYITDREGRLLIQSPEQSFSLPVNGSAVIQQSLLLNNPVLWSVETPYLYRLVTVVKSGGKELDRVTTRFGIRTITFDKDSGLYVNGKNVKVKGVNCHQDHAGVGSALPDYLQYYRIRLLKEMGVNAYRASHNPPTPELLDACDSLGMLVMDETRQLNSGHEYMNQFERMLLRDRNHPSIFMWSIGNEEGWIHTNSIGRRIAQSMLAKQQELDPTRTSTYAADVANVFTGVNEVIPIRGFNYRVPGVDPYHRDHPHQPIIGTEMGSTVTTRGIYVKDSINCYVPDQDITFPWWADRAETWWSQAAERPFWMGGFVWTGFDYRGEPTPYQWPNINSHFGIMDMCGFPKNIYYYYQSWWADKDVLHISPHWNWSGRTPSQKGGAGDTIDVWVNSNAQQVELFLNGKSLGKKEMQPNRHLQWKVLYKPGIVKAIGYRNGKKIQTQVETTDDAWQVVLTPDQTTLTADGKDATVINVTVKDKKGREVPNAGHLIQFAVQGNGAIIGVGNGDPSSHEPDKYLTGQWQRRLFNGKCQLILQAGTAAGDITVEASANGLQKATLTIQSHQ
ncbi:glycoside hydrolase family 2 protein [Pseudoflavitalea sp. X16]|uniref:beta-galactosidase GalA n=1 Tax=Paraflavitalea devenefica TaxID=2716334 RepID=UPI001420C2B2|nr:beta-galactosidase GalA [Paraflavitalea devenefica]NII25289.1 glycoside hydrolase family 2 protein [Paraflavitalea devenefica]